MLAAHRITPEQPTDGRTGIMPTDDDLGGELAPDEPRADQPARDDLLDPEDIDPEWEGAPAGDEDAGVIPSSDELPESQGADVLAAEQLSEDASPRRLLSDEEAETDVDPLP